MDNEDNIQNITGIFYKLYNKDHDLIKVKASSQFRDDILPEIVVQNQKGHSFWTKDEPNSSITIETTVLSCPSAYAIRAPAFIGEPGEPVVFKQIRSWKLEGLNENGDWIEIDTESEPIKAGTVFYKVISVNDWFSQFKLTQTGKNGSNDNVFVVGSFDIYGQYKKEY